MNIYIGKITIMDSLLKSFVENSINECRYLIHRGDLEEDEVHYQQACLDAYLSVLNFIIDQEK